MTKNINIGYYQRILVFFFVAPLAPAMIPEDCSAENNSVTVAWQVPNHSFVEGYVLELDDGSGGEFRVSFSFVVCHNLEKRKHSYTTCYLSRGKLL